MTMENLLNEPEEQSKSDRFWLGVFLGVFFTLIVGWFGVDGYIEGFKKGYAEEYEGFKKSYAEEYEKIFMKVLKEELSKDYGE